VNWFISGAASLLALPIRVLITVGRLPRRLWHLAQMRANCSGSIPVTLQFDGPVRVSGRPVVRFGEHCRLGRGVFLETSEGGTITVGRHVRINAGCFLVSYAGITIGDDCLIGEYTSIRDANHRTDGAKLIREQGHDSVPIVIGSNVWIGRGTTILKGVRIGDGAVVGANSVVTHDVPAGGVVAGCPARPLRQRSDGAAPEAAE
jgi:acetyltransferase-like isoleucine patch superfamily enzyme